MTTDNSLISEPTVVTLQNQFQVNIERLKTRQLFKLLKIITRGAGEVLPTLSVNASTSQEEFAGTLLAAMIFAIPEAEEETVEFLKSMVTPADIREPVKSKMDEEHNDQQRAMLAVIFDNLEIEDLIDVLEKIVELEAPHIVSVGKRLGTLLKAQNQSQEAKSSKN